MPDFQSRTYRSLLEKWAKPVLDSLDELDSLPQREGAITANVDDLIAEILFHYNLITISECKGLEAYGKTPQFAEFYAYFKQTSIYKDMEQIRQAQNASSKI